MRRAVFVSDQIVRPSADTHNFRDTRSLKSNFFLVFDISAAKLFIACNKLRGIS